MATLTLSNDGNCLTATWTTGTGTDTGSSADFKQYNDRTVTCSGTFDSATITVEGSNSGSNWFTLHAVDGSNATFTAAGIKTLLEAPKLVRVSSASGGASAAVTTRIHGTGGY